MSESSAVDSSASEGQKNGEQTLSDRTLRHVENDVLISKIIRKKAHEVCFDPFVREFEDCVRGRTLSIVWKCRAQNRAMQTCLKKYYTSDEFHEQCTQEYLQQREEFRKTNVSKKHKKPQYYGQ